MPTDLNRVRAANGPLNAFVEWDEGAVGGSGPLAGRTVGVKANIAVRGLHWTAGMALYRDRIAERDAEAVARLRQSGAAIIGVLNMEEAALGAKTDNPWFGATHNPHRPGFTPGGSSGGSAAAVAAGLCDAALGTDTMGSVRVPAAYCGIYGFKPANAAISQDGLEIAERTLDVIGPLARSIDLLEQVTRIISDFREDAAGPPVALADLGGVECHLSAQAAYERAIAALGPVETIVLADSLSRIRFAGFIRTARSLHAHFADAPPGSLSPALTSLLAYGARRSDRDFAEDEAVLARTARTLRDIVGSHTLMLPTTPQPAFAHDRAAPANQADFTCLANIAGLPAISIPAGWTSDAMPVGVQLVGRPGAEAGLFRMARQLDTVLDAYRRPGCFVEDPA